MNKSESSPEQTSAYLAQLLWALQSLTEFDEKIWRQTLFTLKLEPASFPYPQLGQPLAPDLEAWIKIIPQLARRYQELLRRSVTLWEQQQELGLDPLATALLGNFSGKFAQASPHHAPGSEPNTILKPLIDLLFYSGAQGQQRLAGVLESLVSLKEP
jgi:hypothetical protein